MSDETKHDATDLHNVQNDLQSARFDARAEAVRRNVLKRLATNAGSGVGAAVATGATSVAIAFTRREPDAAYGIAINASWSTTVRVAPADKSATGFTARFGTAAPAGATIDWLVFRAG